MTLFDPRLGVFGIFMFIRKELHDDPPIVHDTVGPIFSRPIDIIHYTASKCQCPRRHPLMDDTCRSKTGHIWFIDSKGASR
jgi:hypothetical protein